MKKAIFLGLFLLLVLPLTSFAAFDQNLKYGAKGSAVIELQEFLTDQGVYSGPITGNFYSLTLAGVKAFQDKYEISPVSGYWGPLSRIQANNVLSLNVSNQTEINETGTITPPIVEAPISYQPPQNPPQTITPTNPLIEEPKQVLFDIPFAFCSKHDKVDYVSFYCSNIQKNDKFTLSISGLDPIIITVDKVSGKYNEFGIGSEPKSLNPDTHYTYSLKIERANEYAVISGSFKTLKN